MEKATHYLDVRLAVNFHETLKPEVIEGFKMALGVSSEEAIFGAYAKMIVNEIESDIVKKRFDHLVLVDAELSEIDYDVDLKVEEAPEYIEEPTHDYPDEYLNYDEYNEYINELKPDDVDFVYMAGNKVPDKEQEFDPFNTEVKNIPTPWTPSDSESHNENVENYAMPLGLSTEINMYHDSEKPIERQEFSEEKEIFWELLDEITEDLFVIKAHSGTDIEVFLEKDLYHKYNAQITPELSEYISWIQIINEFDYPYPDVDDNYKYIISYIDARDEIKHVYKKIEDTKGA